jgi:hypothetical protein
VVPSLASDSALRDWFRGHERLGASPSAAMTLMRMDSEIDIRHVLPAIRVPTLVLHRGGDTFVDVAAGRYLGAHIPDARYVELQGNDHLPEFGDAEAILDRMEEFLTGSIAVVERDRVLATVMFVDMVDSTRTAATLGDKAWREVSDRYHRAIAGEISRTRGRIIKSTGDGVLATFDGPARAIRCGLAMCEAVASVGLALKVGLHSGEIELMGDDIGGIAVHVAARVAALAGAGEVLATFGKNLSSHCTGALGVCSQAATISRARHASTTRSRSAALSCRRSGGARVATASAPKRSLKSWGSVVFLGMVECCGKTA